MEEFRRFSYVKQVTATKGTEEFHDLLEIRSGQTLMVQRVIFDFPTEAKGYVYCSIWKGNTQVIPDEGEVTTYSGQIELITDKLWESGTRIRLKTRNTDNTADKMVLVIIEGVYYTFEKGGKPGWEEKGTSG